MQKILVTILLLLFSSFAFANNNFYQPYRDRAQALAASMSLDEMIGQIVLPSYELLANSGSIDGSLCKKVTKKGINKNVVKICGLDQIRKYHIGAVLQGGAPYFEAAPSLLNWTKLNKLAQKQHRLGCPKDPLLLIGNDAIHGNQHIQGSVIFPQNINLGVTHDSELVEAIGRVVAEDSLISGFNWIYMPTVAVAQDLRWGRTYESFGQQPALVKQMAKAYVAGFQQIRGNKITGTLATAKHFIGDGATQFGLDQGDDAYTGTLTNFWLQNGQGYEGALQAHVGSIMVSFNAIECDNTRMHFGGKWNILNRFKRQGIKGSDNNYYQFNGFAVSDWNGATHAAYFFNKLNNTKLTLPEVMAKTINGGVDMIMLGPFETINIFDLNSTVIFNKVGTIVTAIKNAYSQGLISKRRLQEAATRILTVKLAISSQTPKNYRKLQTVERELALKAAEESLVLLKNTNKTIPLQESKIKNVIFIGNVDDIGLQNGGWTINWQGQTGNQYFSGTNKFTSGATTLKNGIKDALKKYHVRFYYANKETNLPRYFSSDDTVAIALLAEPPYAEFMGDIGNEYKEDPWYRMGVVNKYNKHAFLPQPKTLAFNFSKKQGKLISRFVKQGIPIITVIYSGRPVIITSGKVAPLNVSNSVVAASLPGTLGGKALANLIFGHYHARSRMNGESNTLTFPWPRNMKDINSHFKTGSLFPIGFGLAS